MASLNLAGRSILVLDDEPLICLDVAKRLQDAGASVLSASHLQKALILADRPGLSAAVLDFDLGNADSSALCWKLADRHIPFLFHTGRVYSAFQQWPSAPVILKASAHSLIAAVDELLH